MEEDERELAERTEDPQHGKSVYWYFSVLAALVLAGWIGTWQWKNHLPVQHIVVEGQTILTKEEIVRLMNVPAALSMYDMDLTMLQKNIEANPIVKRVTVKRDAPSALRVNVEERKPEAILNVGRNEVVCLDEEGYVIPCLSVQAVNDLPIISGADSSLSLTVGQRTTNPELLAALEIVKTSKAIGMNFFREISEIRIHHGHDIVFYTSENGLPVLFGRGDIAKKLVKLDSFWQQFHQQSSDQNLEYIDVRFEDQVVVGRKKKS